MPSSSEVNTQQTIKPRGTIQNMLNQGFSERACISENIDDSLGAKATVVRIQLDTKSRVLIHSDNGKGMNKQECFEAHCLNSRKDKSRDRQGRFGIGRKQAQAVMTNLDATSKTLTKSKCSSPNEENGEGVIELDINWKECIEKDIYEVQPHDITVKSLPIWTKYAIDPKMTGTVTMIPCSSKIFESLLHQINTKNIQESLIFHFGRTYYKYMEEDGLKIQVFVDGKEIPLVPINPLLPAYTEKNTRVVHPLAVLSNKEGQLRVYYKNEAGESVYRDFTASTPGKQMLGDIPKEWMLIGRIDLTCIYLIPEKLVSCFKIDTSRYIIPTDEGKSGIQDLRSFLCGSYYSRNGKVITRFGIQKPSSGDRAHYKYHQDIIQFIAFDSDLDDFFDIQVNKSKIDVENVGGEIRQTIRYLTSEFSKKMLSEFCVCDACVKPAPRQTQPLVEQRPLSNPIVMPVAPKPTVSLPVQVPKSQPVIATPVAKPAVPPATTHTVVEAHVREQSKSARDIIGLAMNLADKINYSPNIEEVYNKTSVHSQAGYVKYWNTLHEVEKLLKDLGVKLED
jgi:hypothetical protein